MQVQFLRTGSFACAVFTDMYQFVSQQTQKRAWYKGLDLCFSSILNPDSHATCYRSQEVTHYQFLRAISSEVVWVLAVVSHNLVCVGARRQYGTREGDNMSTGLSLLGDCDPQQLVNHLPLSSDVL